MHKILVQKDSKKESFGYTEPERLITKFTTRKILTETLDSFDSPTIDDDVGTITLLFILVFIMKQGNENWRQGLHVSVGTMKDYKLNLRNLHVSDTQDYSGNWNT